jgi:8-oxo-dGTP pyrophosphatase MutT (NUDIX family)
MIRCACLVRTSENRILLTQVRNNPLWYLPGGKIEPDELPQQALVRELNEELGVAVDLRSVDHLYTVVGPAYGHEGDVELICFSATWEGEAVPQAEITGLEWIGFHEEERMAPAVKLLIAKHLS